MSWGVLDEGPIAYCRLAFTAEVDAPTKAEDVVSCGAARLPVYIRRRSKGRAWAVLTAVWPDWIEALTGFDPDHGGGAFEWILAVGCGLSALVLGAIARREWRRTLSAAPA